MHFYLSLTDNNGIVLDRFRLELPQGENAADGCVGEDSEAVGDRLSDAETCYRLLRGMRHAIKASTQEPKA